VKATNRRARGDSIGIRGTGDRARTRDNLTTCGRAVALWITTAVPYMLARMFGNPGASADVLGLPIGVVVLGIAIIGFVVGTVWLWRITRQHESGDDSWRFLR
jgi:hypothetical protein